MRCYLRPENCLSKLLLYCSQLYSHTLSALNAGAKKSGARAIWPCLNVATWRRERSDRTIQQI